MTTSADKAKQEPPGLMSSSPVGALALLAVGTGFIALVSLGVEVWTGQALAKTFDLGVPFISAPLGVGTVIMAALTAKNSPKFALPSIICGALYWLIFMLAA